MENQKVTEELNVEIKKLFKMASAEEINNELAYMVSTYIQEGELDPKAAAQSALIGMTLQNFFTKVERIVNKS